LSNWNDARAARRGYGSQDAAILIQRGRGHGRFCGFADERISSQVTGPLSLWHNCAAGSAIREAAKLLK